MFICNHNLIDSKKKLLFISPPFGNYINLPNTISIKGSYTLYPRKGLFIQIIKTLRYSFEYGGWINKIGLRNKGIDYAIKNYNHNHIVSIAILEKEDIIKIKNKIPDNMNIELNVSCPNTKKEMINENLDVFLNNKRKWCIIKLSPTTKMEQINNYYKKGFRQFHCSNTLKIKYGGLSGESLIPYNLNLIKKIREKYNDVLIIAGGGVTNLDVANDYLNKGANHISVSTLLFSPISFFIFYKKFIN